MVDTGCELQGRKHAGLFIDCLVESGLEYAVFDGLLPVCIEIGNQFAGKILAPRFNEGAENQIRVEILPGCLVDQRILERGHLRAIEAIGGIERPFDRCILGLPAPIGDVILQTRLEYRQFSIRRPSALVVIQPRRKTGFLRSTLCGQLEQLHPPRSDHCRGLCLSYSGARQP